jgi:hypothetical protein
VGVRLRTFWVGLAILVGVAGQYSTPAFAAGHERRRRRSNVPILQAGLQNQPGLSDRGDAGTLTYLLQIE